VFSRRYKSSKSHNANPWERTRASPIWVQWIAKGVSWLAGLLDHVWLRSPGASPLSTGIRGVRHCRSCGDVSPRGLIPGHVTRVVQSGRTRGPRSSTCSSCSAKLARSETYVERPPCPRARRRLWARTDLTSKTCSLLPKGTARILLSGGVCLKIIVCRSALVLLVCVIYGVVERGVRRPPPCYSLFVASRLLLP